MSQSTPINLIRRGDTSLPPPMDPSLQQSGQLPAMPMGGSMMGGDNMQMGGMGGMSSDSQLRGIPGMSSDSQLVEDILKEMGTSPGIAHQSDINSQAFQHVMDSSQVPPNQYIPPSGAVPPSGWNGNYSATQKMMMDNQSNGLLTQFGINLNGESIKDKIMKNIKYPLLVFVLCFIISLPEFNRFLFGFFPRLLLESGQVSFGGVLLKSLIGMIIFSIIVLFI